MTPKEHRPSSTHGKSQWKKQSRVLSSKPNARKCGTRRPVQISCSIRQPQPKNITISTQQHGVGKNYCFPKDRSHYDFVWHKINYSKTRRYPPYGIIPCKVTIKPFYAVPFNILRVQNAPETSINDCSDDWKKPQFNQVFSPSPSYVLTSEITVFCLIKWRDGIWWICSIHNAQTTRPQKPLTEQTFQRI